MPLLLRKEAPSPSIDELIIDINSRCRKQRPNSEKSRRTSSAAKTSDNPPIVPVMKQRARSEGADNIDPEAVRQLEFEMKVMHKTPIGKFIARRRNDALLSKRRKNPQIGDFEHTTPETAAH